MSPHCLRLCSEALGVDLDAVVDLAAEDELEPALMAAMVLALRSPGAAVVAPLWSEGTGFCAAVARGWGHAPFTASELLEWCGREATAQQRDVLAACGALCGRGVGDGAPSTRALGARLAELRKMGHGSGSHRVALVNKNGGVATWAVELVEVE